MGVFQSNVLTRLLGPAPDAQADACMNTPPAPAAIAAVRKPVLIAYATQTGAAEGYAQATHEQLHAAGIETRVLEFYDLTLEVLAATHQALFIASTTYEGDPPDMAEEFHAACMDRSAHLPDLRFGLLALGDRDYDTFCGFGRSLNRWLLASGAQPLFAPVEVDDENADALELWFSHISRFVDAHARALPA